MAKNDKNEPAQIVIAGGGIVGLVLALAIKKHLNIIPEIYEKAHEFYDDVGAALGMYPNGLRVIRDIDPDLLKAIQNNGSPYLYRRWEKHDGTSIAVADESVLADGDKDLYSVGIRRWRLQKVLYDAVVAAGIPIHFAKATVNVIERDTDNLIEVHFADGTSRVTELLFGADGGKSQVRQLFADPSIGLKYTGVTCLMGIANCCTEKQGIYFPSSTVSEFHAVYFPTGDNEQCFQIHFPVKEEDSNKEDWGNLSIADGKVQFEKLAHRLEEDGWAEKYIEPLYQVEHAVRVGFALLEPSLDQWVYGKNNRIVLVGDACHPPVPYVGQGAQMGVEDAGTMVLLMKELCLDEDGKLNLQRFSEATKYYEQIRIPRARRVLNCSKRLGSRQERRSHESSALLEDILLQGEVMMNDTLDVMFTGASYNYANEVLRTIEMERQKSIILLSPTSHDEEMYNEEMLKQQAFEEIWGGSTPFC